MSIFIEAFFLYFAPALARSGRCFRAALHSIGAREEANRQPLTPAPRWWPKEPGFGREAALFPQGS